MHLYITNTHTHTHICSRVLLRLHSKVSLFLLSLWVFFAVEVVSRRMSSGTVEGKATQKGHRKRRERCCVFSSTQRHHICWSFSRAYMEDTPLDHIVECQKREKTLPLAFRHSHITQVLSRLL